MFKCAICRKTGSVEFTHGKKTICGECFQKMNKGEYMTIKEMAGQAGVSKQSIANWIRRLYPGVEMVRGRVTNLNREQALKIMGSVNKKNFVTPIEKTTTLSTKTSTLSNDNSNQILTVLTSILDRMDKRTYATEDRLSKLEDKYVERKALLPAPQMTDRANINKLVRAYVEKYKMTHSEGWGVLYSNFYYIYNKNIKLCAKNRNMKPLDYVAETDMMSELLSIAIDLEK